MLGSNTVPLGLDDALNLEGSTGRDATSDTIRHNMPSGTRQQRANQGEMSDSSETVPPLVPQATVDIAPLERLMQMSLSSELRGEKVRLARMPQPSSKRSLPDATATCDCDHRAGAQS